MLSTQTIRGIPPNSSNPVQESSSARRDSCLGSSALFLEVSVRPLRCSQSNSYTEERVEENAKSGHGIKNENDRSLEIDIYYPNLHLGFEYQASYLLFLFLSINFF